MNINELKEAHERYKLLCDNLDLNDENSLAILGLAAALVSLVCDYLEYQDGND